MRRASGPGAVWFHGCMADAVEMVKHYLKAQNYEQVGRVDDAIGLYEVAIEGGFDAAGPYDRLIHIYSHRALHKDVVRVSDAALEQVRTYDDKRSWYEQMRAEALKAQGDLPEPAPKKRGE
jgi:hypothetical protein